MVQRLSYSRRYRHLAREFHKGDAMARPQRPEQSTQHGWLDELIAVVRLLCPAQVSPAGQDATERRAAANAAKRRGAATPDEKRGAGWFSVPLAGQTFESDQLEAAYLAPAEGGSTHRFQLIETVHDGNVLRVRAAEHAPRSGLFVWVPERDTGRLYTSLFEGLSSITQFDLVDRIAAGNADPLRAERPGEQERTSDLNDGQRRALRACLAPGVHLVWGPPGTGKTQVISSALQELMDRGKSVLLVSGTNIAVDNALERAARDINPASGVMVRVGDPHLPEIADNPAICLDALIRERQRELESRRHELTERIATLKNDATLTHLEAERAALAGFDSGAYRAAVTRLRNAEDLNSRHASYEVALQAAAHVRRAEATAIADLNEAARLHAEAQAARPYLDAVDTQNRHLGFLGKAVEDASQLVTRRERERDEAAETLSAARNPFGRGRRRASLQAAEDNLADSRAALDTAQLEYLHQAPLVTAEISASRQAAQPHSRESLAALDLCLAEANRAADRAARATAAREGRAREANEAVAMALAWEQPTDADIGMVARADADGLPARHANLSRAVKATAAVQRQIDRLESEHEELLARMRKGAPQLRKAIVENARVVATTLAMLRMRPELREREYDHVLIDEVSFAPPPDVIYAASRASTGVTLLGDFLQNGPILPEKIKGLRNSREKAKAERWYGRDLFSFFGITDSNAALGNPGCAVLTRQYRFGPAVNKLANAAAYGGILTVGRTRPDDEQNGPEIVFVDVDGLGSDLTDTRRGLTSGWWWPVGALVARALAVQRVKQGSKVGVVVPFRSQADLVQEMVREDGLELNVSVGTAHAFQGREFDTVIFDLVDNNGTGWIAAGDLHEGLSGLRVFNVGITRTKQRLYMIGNATAVRGAKRGPLQAIHALGKGEVRVVRAQDILGRTEMPEDDPVASEIWTALHDQVTIVGVYDERLLPDELRRRLDHARDRVWLWSPWVGQSSQELLPHLRAAQDRKVLVHPVVLWPEEVQPQLRDLHQTIGAELARTVYLKNMHQKIIIIDDHLTFIGSMNVLAHPRNGRLETMALFDSRALARQYLNHERADELGKPPTCGDCQAPVRRVLRSSENGRAQLYWVCNAPTATGTCNWRKPFPAADGGRYEWQPRKQPKRSRA
jgi:KaiC/GvpD/RAD55 family RecA-like ATPase